MSRSLPSAGDRVEIATGIPDRPTEIVVLEHILREREREETWRARTADGGTVRVLVGCEEEAADA